jgi:erythronate-4-phosphate dehydrogenase
MYRIYVERKKGFENEALSIKSELTGFLGIDGITNVRYLNRYDVENVTEAVIKALRDGLLKDAIIDVWEDEPSFSSELADLAFLATPHLAGHSYEGKTNGTIAVYHAACSYLGHQPSLHPILPPPIVPRIDIDATGKSDEEVLWFLTQKISMIVADHLNFLDIIHLSREDRRRRFVAQRRTYPYRRQFCATTVYAKHASPSLLAKIAALGFQLPKN